MQISKSHAKLSSRFAVPLNCFLNSLVEVGKCEILAAVWKTSTLADLERIYLVAVFSFLQVIWGICLSLKASHNGLLGHISLPFYDGLMTDAIDFTTTYADFRTLELGFALQ
jgi:hypothetical protein